MTSRTHCVVVFEPALPGEHLDLATQVHQVVGPFADGDAADAWVSLHEELCKVDALFASAPSKFTYLITSLDATT